MIMIYLLNKEVFHSQLCQITRRYTIQFSIIWMGTIISLYILRPFCSHGPSPFFQWLEPVGFSHFISSLFSQGMGPRLQSPQQVSNVGQLPRNRMHCLNRPCLAGPCFEVPYFEVLYHARNHIFWDITIHISYMLRPKKRPYTWQVSPVQVTEMLNIEHQSVQFFIMTLQFS